MMAYFILNMKQDINLSTEFKQVICVHVSLLSLDECETSVTLYELSLVVACNEVLVCCTAG